MAALLPHYFHQDMLSFIFCHSLRVIAIALYIILGVVASLAIFSIREFAHGAQQWPTLIGIVLRPLKNFDSLFDK